MPAPNDAFYSLVYQTLDAAAALLESGQPEAALTAIRPLGQMDITARQRRRYEELLQAIEERLAGESWVTLQLTCPRPLTLNVLSGEVMSLLRALTRLHDVLAQLEGKQPVWDPEIRQMSHHASFSVTLGGWNQAIMERILGAITSVRRPARLTKPLPTRRFEAAKELVSPSLSEDDPAHLAVVISQIWPEIEYLTETPLEAQIIASGPERLKKAASGGSEEKRGRPKERATTGTSEPPPTAESLRTRFSAPFPTDETVPEPDEDRESADEEQERPSPRRFIPRRPTPRRSPVTGAYPRRTTRPVPKPTRPEPDEEPGDSEDDWPPDAEEEGFTW